MCIYACQKEIQVITERSQHDPSFQFIPKTDYFFFSNQQRVESKQIYKEENKNKLTGKRYHPDSDVLIVRKMFQQNLFKINKSVFQNLEICS